MRIEWQLTGRIRADIVAYAGKNLNGKRTTMRIFPSGNKQGRIVTEELTSMVIRAPYGTRVLLITQPGPDWEQHAWRCVSILEGQALPPGGSKLPGVRIPDLDLLDPCAAKKTDPDTQVSYRYVGSLEDGEGWTFGRGGEPGLRRQVRLIRIEAREAGPQDTLDPAQVALVGLVQDVVGAAADDARPAIAGLLVPALRSRLADMGVSASRIEAIVDALASGEEAPTEGL